MNNIQPALSVIVIAANEESYVKRALQSIRDQHYPNYEIILVVNGSTDATYEQAQGLADKVVEYPDLLGASTARNIGAALSKGNMLVFLDADSFMSKDVLASIAKHSDKQYFGTVLGKPDKPSIIFSSFFFFKNITHRLGLYKGALGGLMFCTRELFYRVQGFNAKKIVDEIYDMSLRTRLAGGRYKLITSAYAYTSMRRFKKEGIFKLAYFWLRVWFLRFIGKEDHVFHEYKLKF
jgi:glycosyltransferase involved in cell wall biosynthesis